MAAAAGIWNSHHAAAGPLGQLSQLTGGKLSGSPLASATATSAATASPADNSSSSSSSSTDSSTISANDFLTLLVTEMQNQDPTADTDPNEYINQLVQVNSLEQLIDINQNLQTVLGTASSQPSSNSSTATPASAATAGSATRAAANALSQAQSGSATAGPSLAKPGAGPGGSWGANPSPPATTSGNIGIPSATPASLQVAQALSGKPHNQSLGHGKSFPR